MKIPKIQGSLNQSDFFIYVACDKNYFDEFAIKLVNSVKKNTSAGIHLHIFNPLDSQIDKFSQDSRVSVSYEYVKIEDFTNAAENLQKLSNVENEKFKYERSLTAMKKGNDKNLIERVMKTYFACARFVRLRELVKNPQEIFAIDIDAVVRKEIPKPAGNYDFFIHHISGKKSRFLAGGMYFLKNFKSVEYLDQYADILKQNIENNHLYWSLDQDVLDKIVPNFNYGALPMPYIDWNMSNDSYVWTAKGERKSLPIFVNESLKYSS